MNRIQFDRFFRIATEKSAPYGYQCRLACGPDADPDKPDTLRDGTACSSQLINIPTGLGKTAAVVLAWLWNRVAPSLNSQPSTINSSQWPRRLVYCLPMRTLVEQTRDEAKRWVAALHKNDLLQGKPPKVIILMGGEELEGDAKDWDLYPEENAIIIGTQDMLLSRALNRGYGMSRYRWPMHFGLLNNDCLWVMDEAQLMGVGVETSAQLDGFRHNGSMPIFGACPTWWMSATLDSTRLTTVDHPKPADGWLVETLSDAEQSSGSPHDLITAAKKLSRAALKGAPVPLTLNPATNDYARQLAGLVKERHQTGTLTLVVVNRVKRAREIFEALVAGKSPVYKRENVALIHSRFRPVDRGRHTKLLFNEGDRVVIATQAVEAGIDVSARLLITELAPWSSLVQRMGRCNRRADIADAEVLWINIDPDTKGELLLPYSKVELDRARTAITPLTDASPRALCEIKIKPEPLIRPVIRRRDLVDLFDTTPDICGQDLDISRYIRDEGDNDVQFFWRDISKGEMPPANEPQPDREELCRVSIGEAAKFLKSDRVRAWRWDPLGKEWKADKSPRPGAVYLLDSTSGGYEDDLGWTGEVKVKKLTTHRPPDKDNDSHDADPDTYARSWQTIAEHTKFVVRETETLAGLTNDAILADALRTAALWHDIGKAHGEFQNALRDGACQPPGANGLFAKSENPPKRYSGDKPYRSIRHELASALAWLIAGPPDGDERDLVAYLIAAHHGKVRLSIRSLPNEKGDEKDPERLFARGIWQGDKLPSVDLGEFTTPEITLDLSFMRMGEGPRGPSWLARTVALRDRADLGPFRLAYLETLLRAADARASVKAGSHAKPGMELREEPPSHGETGLLSPAEQSLVADLVADGLSIQDKFRPEPLYKQTGKGHYEGDTVGEVRKAKESKSKGKKR